MRKLAKLKVILLIFSIIFVSYSVAAERILPVPKPSVDQETKKKVERKKEIYPESKPKKKQVDVSEKISETTEEPKEEVSIYPQKRPVIVKKKIDKVIALSLIHI